jgi:hypothetical protein
MEVLVFGHSGRIPFHNFRESPRDHVSNVRIATLLAEWHGRTRQPSDGRHTSSIRALCPAAEASFASRVTSVASSASAKAMYAAS